MASMTMWITHQTLQTGRTVGTTSMRATTRSMDYFRMTQNKQIIQNKKHKFPRLTKVQYYLRNKRLTSTTSRIYHTETGASIVYKEREEDNIINDED
eukprot:2786482-Amphidinium_carterae.1